MTHDDATAALALAAQAKFSGLVDLLIEKGLIADSETPKIIQKALAFLEAPQVGTASTSEVQAAARALLSGSLGAMQR